MSELLVITEMMGPVNQFNSGLCGTAEKGFYIWQQGWGRPSSYHDF